MEGKLEDLIRTWSGRQLFLKGRVEVVRLFIASIIIYNLIIVDWPGSCLDNLERLPFRLLWKGGKPFVRRSVFCQETLQGGLRILWLLLCKYALRVGHLKNYLVGDQMWNPLVWKFFLEKFRPGFLKRSCTTEWQNECRKALMLINWAEKACLKRKPSGRSIWIITRDTRPGSVRAMREIVQASGCRATDIPRYR